MNVTLWIVQGIVAVLFLLAGYTHGFQPREQLAKRMSWVAAVPPVLMRFIGVSEILGAIGLIAPAATDILPWLTVAAAGGLTLLMLCAAVFHVARREYSNSIGNAVLLIAAAFVLVGRLAIARF